MLGRIPFSERVPGDEAARPRREVYGHVAVFEDLYGNKWDLLEPLG